MEKLNEAFKHLISQHGWHKISGIDIATARSHKKHFKDGSIHERTIVWLLYRAKYFDNLKIPAK